MLARLVLLPLASLLLAHAPASALQATRSATRCLSPLQGTESVEGLLQAGDIIVFGSTASEPRAVVHVDPATGAQTFLQGAVPFGQFIAVDRDGFLYGSIDRGPSSRIDRLDLATGVLDTLSAGENLFRPRGIAVDVDGSLLVTDEQLSFFPPSDAILLRVDAGTGAQTVLARNVFLSRPKDLDLDTDGTVVVADDTLWGAVFRVDPVTGMQTTVSEDMQSSLLAIAMYIAAAPGGDIFVNHSNGRGVVRVDPATGEQSTAFPGTLTPPPLRGIKDALDGFLHLAYADGMILRFEPDTGNIRGRVTSGGMLIRINSIAVVPPPTTPPEVTCSVDVDSLWPPNHSLVDVGLDVSVEHGAATAVTVEVYSDEDDLELGSGNHAPDARDLAAGTLLLRSERSGKGDGRVYLIVATAEDAFGNSGSSCCTVVVPKSQSAKSRAGVLQRAADAEETCEETGDPPAEFVPVGEVAVGLARVQSGPRAR